MGVLVWAAQQESTLAVPWPHRARGTLTANFIPSCSLSLFTYQHLKHFSRIS